MDIRKLIKEEVAKVLNYEHKLSSLRNTDFKSPFHLGSKPYTAKDIGLQEKPLPFRPVENTPTDEYHKRNDRTQQQKELEGGANYVGMERSPIMEAPKMDVIMCGAILVEFNVNKIFKDLNGNHVFHLGLKDRVNEQKKDRIPGGLSSGLSLSDIANKHEVEYSKLKSQLQKGIRDRSFIS